MLENYLISCPVCLYSSPVNIFPGPRRKSISRELSRITKRTDRYSAIFVICGICSITRKRSDGRILLGNYNVESTVNYVIDDFYSLIVNVRVFTSAPIIICPIVGVDLMRYSSHDWFSFKDQPILDCIVNKVNLQIRGINRLNGLTTPDLSSKVHHCSGHGGKYRSHYGHLWDGCHPSHHLREWWEQKIMEYYSYLSGSPPYTYSTHNCYLSTYSSSS